MRLLSYSLSDVGKKRDHNEDSFLVEDKLALYAVADGMGGHQAGERASRMAIETLVSAIAAPEVFGSDDYGFAIILFDGPVPPVLEAATRRAEGNCPEQAVIIEP